MNGYESHTQSRPRPQLLAYVLSLQLRLFDVGTDYLQAKAIVVPDICMSQEATKARKSDS